MEHLYVTKITMSSYSYYGKDKLKIYTEREKSCYFITTHAAYFTALLTQPHTETQQLNGVGGY